MVSAQFKTFNSQIEHTGVLNALFSSMRSMKEGLVTDHPSLAKSFPEVVQRIGASTIPELREQVVVELGQTLTNANAIAKKSFAETVAVLLIQLDVTNSMAVIPEDVFQKYHRSPRLKDLAKPDLLYRLLMIPGHQATLANTDQLALNILADVNKNLSTFAVHAARATPEANLVVMAEIKGRLEDTVDVEPTAQCRNMIDSLGIIYSGRTYNRMQYTFDVYRGYGKKVRIDSWYPELFITLSKLPLAGKLFGKHDEALPVALNALVNNVNVLSDLITSERPPFITELYVELMHQTREALEVVAGLIDMRSLFIKNYHELKTALAD